ncbi:Bgt-20164 [Blumeria graminis f. sp. tritici]|uniref:Bgt-20164 n=2 Tax=Blumeria graminis f. sp. tritici TaxID=62690 RepID=A0A381L9N3_BLUGR|nr:Bgt-20164 [Blumeria graminis f. sp. tritici]
MRSLSLEYHTTIENLTKRDKFPNLFEVFQSARTTKTKLAELDEHVPELELANAVVGNHIRQKNS